MIVPIDFLQMSRFENGFGYFLHKQRDAIRLVGDLDAHLCERGLSPATWAVMRFI